MTHRGVRRAAALGWQLLLLVGCTEDIRLFTDAGLVSPPPAAARVDAAVAAAMPSATDAGLSASGAACESAAQNALASLRQAPVDSCGSLAAETFRYNACACVSMVLSAPFTSDGLDSSRGPYVPAEPGAGLGSNRSFVATADLTLLGSLRVAGAGGATLMNGTAHIRGSASLEGPLTLSHTDAQLERDLWVGGNIVLSDSQVRVAGTLYQPPGRVFVGALSAGGGVMTRQVNVEPPCPCSGMLAQLGVMFAAADSDSAVITLPASALSDANGLTLSCGRYRVNGDGVIGASRWVVERAAVLIVAGDLEVDSRLEVELGERGELDVFVQGALRLQPGAQIATARPAALRFYVQAQSDLRLTGGARFTGNLYAPDSTLRVMEEQTFAASLVVRELFVDAPTTIHYDRAVLRPSGAANGCSDAACSTDTDCVAPLLCVGGRCGLGAP